MLIQPSAVKKHSQIVSIHAAVLYIDVNYQQGQGETSPNSRYAIMQDLHGGAEQRRQGEYQQGKQKLLADKGVIFKNQHERINHIGHSQHHEYGEPGPAMIYVVGINKK